MRKKRSAKTYDLHRYANVEKPKAAQPGKPAEDRNEKPGRKQLKLGILFLAVFLLYTGIIFASQQIRLNRIEQEIAHTEKELEAVAAERDELEERIHYMSTHNYIESMAREKLGLIKPGEIPYLAVPSDSGSDVQILDKDPPIVEVED